MKFEMSYTDGGDPHSVFLRLHLPPQVFITFLQNATFNAVDQSFDTSIDTSEFCAADVKQTYWLERKTKPEEYNDLEFVFEEVAADQEGAFPVTYLEFP